MNIITTFASTEAATEHTDNDVFSALGIDASTLIFQIIGFLLLVFVLGKFVYPVLLKTIDKRQEEIEASAKAADAAKEQAERAEVEVAKMLKQAKVEAGEIVATAKDEAAGMVQRAEDKAKVKSAAIVASAKDEIAKDVIAAKKALHNETIDLVARATETILGNSIDGKVDKKIVTNALKEAEK